MLLIKNGVVLTMNPERVVYMDGAVAVEGSKILAVAKSDELAGRYPQAEVLDAKGKLIMPGFVNAHVHLFQTLYRGMGDDLPLADWLTKCVYPLSYHLDEAACRVGAMLSAVEMLKSGVTTYVDSHYITRDKRCCDGIAQGTLETGIRGVLCRSTVDSVGSPESFRESVDVAQKECARVIEAYHGKAGGRLSVRVEALNEFSATRDMIKAMYDVSRQYGVGLSMHLAETDARFRGALEQYGCTPVEFLHGMGVLGDHLLLAHCVWVTKQDLLLLKGTGTHVVHNSISNQYLADGVAPISKMLEMGISVALGTDGAASNNNLDMFNTMKAAVMLQKVNNLDALSLRAEQALEMATIGGAEAIGMADRIGSLEEGKQADLILVDLNAVEMVPSMSCVSNLVYAATPGVVDTVMVDGEIVLRDRRTTKVVEEEVLCESNATLVRLVELSNFPFRLCNWKVVS